MFSSQVAAVLSAGRLTYLFSRVLFLAASVWLSHAGDSSGAQDLPSEIAGLQGRCEGRILITPSKRDAGTGTMSSKLLIYDCLAAAFITLPARRDARWSFGDFSATHTGYYFAGSEFVDGVLHGEYELVDSGGHLVSSLARRDLDVHDAVFGDGTVTYMKYVPDRDHLSCLRPTPLHLEIVQEDSSAKRLWSWSSKDKIDRSMNVSTPRTTVLDHVAWWKPLLRPLRHCMTVALSTVTNVEVPRYTWLSSTYPTFQFNYDDYVHANSLQVRPNGDILISSRHLDAVFEIDKATGNLNWIISGPMAKLRGFDIYGDPFRGFSHQHAATIYGDDVLLLFDNGNLLAGRPSRAVLYRIDWKHRRVEFVKHFLEPNGKERPATGSAYLIDKSHVLVGWGYLYPRDRAKEQRGVSVFDIASGQETFRMDFAPGYDSYRVKWSP